MFALKGFHDTKVDEIIKAAEVTSGAFFHHFKGKEDLGFAVIDHDMEERGQCWTELKKVCPRMVATIRLIGFFGVWMPCVRWSFGDATEGEAA
jgi:AcrR family transcriptional regulator